MWVVTPKKVFRSDFFCFLCASTFGKDRVRIFGKKIMWISRSHQKCCWHRRDRIFVDRSLIFAPQCYKRLLRCGKLSSTFLALKDEIKRDFDKGGLQTKHYERIQQQRKASSRKNYNNQLLCRTYRMSLKDVNLRTSCNLTADNKDKYEITSFKSQVSNANGRDFVMARKKS